uniref:Putative hydroxyacyl-CoA:R-2-hydroxyglutaryl-CoA transferase n=3 Tax=Clostridium tyrobutyricum TaxID=1519 RepID=A0A0A7HFF5_CLOTY|nr:putative hydroxyacyl-CoA:R-2-hydroxyglutaryl-CoA transferase [Clostridium tyrobutyricum]
MVYMSNYGKPLAGVKIAELSTFIAAPGCARVLGDWGAKVIKIESLSGDAGRRIGQNYKMPITEEENPLFETMNSNKKGICINIKNKNGMDILHKILGQSDVFITNIRSVSLKKRGLDYETLKEKFPGLIFAQILGYGEKGPDRSKAGFDYTAYFARGGVMGPMMERGTSPINPVVGFGDNQAGVFLGAGICAALYRKSKTGKGEKVTVGLYNTAIYDMNVMIAAAQYRRNEKDRWPITRKEPPSPLINSYKCKDGKWMEICVQEYGRYINAFCKAIGREDLAADKRFSTVENAVKNSEEMSRIIQEEIQKRDLSEWSGKFKKADLAFEKIQSWEDIVNDPQAWDNDYLRKIKYENGNTGIIVNSPVKFNTIEEQNPNRAPKLGENTNIIMSELGYSSEQIEKLKKDKAIA